MLQGDSLQSSLLLTSTRVLLFNSLGARTRANSSLHSLHTPVTQGIFSVKESLDVIWLLHHPLPWDLSPQISSTPSMSVKPPTPFPVPLQDVGAAVRCHHLPSSVDKASSESLKLFGRKRKNHSSFLLAYFSCQHILSFHLNVPRKIISGIGSS